MDSNTTESKDIHETENSPCNHGNQAIKPFVTWPYLQQDGICPFQLTATSSEYNLPLRFPVHDEEQDSCSEHHARPEQDGSPQTELISGTDLDHRQAWSPWRQETGWGGHVTD